MGGRNLMKLLFSRKIQISSINKPLIMLRWTCQGSVIPVPPKTPPKYKRVFEQISRYGTVGLELGISVAIGIAIGFYLDKWLNTSPWLTIFMMLSGTISGFMRIYKALREIEKEEEEQDDAG